MTTEQAAAMIQQNQTLIDAYASMQPLISAVVHDIFPFLAVGAALALGVIFGRSST